MHAALERFYRAYYLRPRPILRIVRDMLRDREVMVRRLREAREFFSFMAQRRQPPATPARAADGATAAVALSPPRCLSTAAMRWPGGAAMKPNRPPLARRVRAAAGIVCLALAAAVRSAAAVDAPLTLSGGGGRALREAPNARIARLEAEQADDAAAAARLYWPHAAVSSKAGGRTGRTTRSMRSTGRATSSATRSPPWARRSRGSASTSTRCSST